MKNKMFGEERERELTFYECAKDPEFWKFVFNIWIIVTCVFVSICLIFSST